MTGHVITKKGAYARMTETTWKHVTQSSHLHKELPENVAESERLPSEGVVPFNFVQLMYGDMKQFNALIETAANVDGALTRASLREAEKKRICDKHDVDPKIVSLDLGWLHIFERLLDNFHNIEWLLENDPMFSVKQAKQKFGSLRVYWEVYCSGDPAELNDVASTAEKLARLEAGHTCEMCGMPGKLETINESFVRTLCPDCKELEEKRIAG